MPRETSFPDGVTSVDVQFIRNSLYQIGVHYDHEYINKIGWPEFVATFVEKFGTPTSGSSSHREWSDGKTRISVAYSGNEEVPEVLGSTAPVYFRRVEEVPKRKQGEKSSAFQEGINVSHHLCARSQHLIAGGGGERIIVRNHTGVILSMISKFL